MKEEKRIIPFPNLKKRVLERGYEALQQQNFQQAFECFSQLQTMGLSTNETELARVICLMELNELNEAIRLCEPLIYEAKPLLMDAIEIYLSLLVQVQRYDEVKETLSWLQWQEGISEEHLEKLQGLMSLAENVSKKMKGTNEEGVPSLEQELEDVLFHSQHVSQQLGMVHALKESNIRLYFNILEKFLKDENSHPIVKTTILLLLMEQNVTECLIVEKFGQYLEVVPNDLQPSTDNPFVWKVLEILEEEIGNENPSLYGLLKEYYIQYLYTTFPFTHSYSENEFAAALYYFGNILQGNERSIEEVSKCFSLQKEENVIILYNHFISLEKYSQFDV